jgi:hypothetical protein
MNDNKQRQYIRKQRKPHILVLRTSIYSSKFKYKFYLIIVMFEYTTYHYSNKGNIYVFSAHRKPTMYLQMIYIDGSQLTTTLNVYIL